MPRTGVVLLLLLAAFACRPSRPPAPALVLSVPHQIDTLDPHARDRTANIMVSTHLYDPLVALDSDMAIRPALALAWSTPDERTWVFTLRDGVTFHDGRTLTAEDVVATIERLKSDPTLECSAYVAQVESVRAQNARTVVLRTRQPSAVLLNKLASVGIVARGDFGNLRTAPNGTGPFRLAGFDGHSVHLVRNASWWGPKPAVSNVTFRLERGPEDAARDVAEGRSHIGQCSTRSAVALVEGRPGVQLVRRTTLGVKYLGFDVAGASTPYVRGSVNPFRSRLVREAISCALNRDALAASVPAFATPASQLVPRVVFGHDPSIAGTPHDLARAKRLLREAGFPDGFDVTLHTRRGGLRIATSVAELLAPAGLRVKVEELPDADFFARAEKGELSFYLTSFACASGDASDLLEAAVHTLDTSRGLGLNNFGRFSDPSVDLAIERSGGIVDPLDRRAALWEIGRRVAAEAILIPLFGDESVWAVRPPFELHPRANAYLLAAEIGITPN